MIIDVIRDWRSFLRTNRIGIADPSILEEAEEASKRSDKAWAEKIVQAFPEFQTYLDYLSSGRPRLTWLDFQTLSDEELVRKQDLVGDMAGLFNSAKVEILLMEIILSTLNSNTPLLLDAGCGIGHRLNFLSSRGIISARSVGIDLSNRALSRALEIAQKEQSRAQFIKGSCAALPVRTCSIDHALSVDVLPWVWKWRFAVRELGRVLRPGGTMFVTYNPEPPRFVIDPRDVLKTLGSIGIDAKTIDGRGLYSVFILGKKP